MTIYEKYLRGELVPGSRQQPAPDKYDDTRLGLEVLARRESGDRDGWYVDGEWAVAEAARTAAEQQAAGKTGADDYDDMTVEDLAAELGRRGLPKSGNKVDLITRLRAHDTEGMPMTDPTSATPEGFATEGDVRDYDGQTVEQLSREAENRGLTKSGTKPELVARLREHDAAQAGTAGTTGTQQV